MKPKTALDIFKICAIMQPVLFKLKKEADMKKADEKHLHSIEFSDPAQAIFNSAFSSTNPLDALKQLTSLLKGKPIFRCEVVKYSSSTGKPIRYAWKPFEKWDGNLWLHSLFNSPSLKKDMPLYEPLHSFLPANKTIVIKNGQDTFVVKHVPSRFEGDIHNGGEVPAHIEFTKAS